MQDSYQSNPVLFKGDTFNSKLAEHALISYLKIIVRLTTQENIQSYNKNQDLISNIDNFKVAIGFGLHAGWAIEGAIGTELKIDISYLSSNVNWSSRLEGLTKTYKKEILFTDTIFNLIKSSFMKQLIRHIDRVSVENSGVINDIYTIDLNVELLQNYQQRKTLIRQVVNKH